jgi:type II secretory pathway pseudopilin PulG
MNGVIIAIGIVFIVVGGVTAIVVSYFRLETHRADAVAMAAYRQLAEQAVANQQQVHDGLDSIDQRLASVERLLRDVG